MPYRVAQRLRFPFAGALLVCVVLFLLSGLLPSLQYCGDSMSFPYLCLGLFPPSSASLPSFTAPRARKAMSLARLLHLERCFSALLPGLLRLFPWRVLRHPLVDNDAGSVGSRAVVLALLELHPFCSGPGLPQCSW
jgi:hypothetical protein